MFLRRNVFLVFRYYVKGCKVRVFGSFFLYNNNMINFLVEIGI